MTTTTINRAAAALLTAVLLAACGGQSSTGGDPVDTPTAPPPATTTPAPEDEPTTGEQPEEEATAEATAVAEPVVVEVDLEERSHGTLARVSRFEVSRDAIRVDVEIVAAADQAFVQFDNKQQNPAKIVDDLGNEYFMVPMEDNTSLDFDGGEVLEGTLTFEGPVAEEASTLQLIFNSESEKDGPTFNDRWQPHLAFPPVDITGASPGEDVQSSGIVEPVVVEVDFEERSPDGTVVQVSRFEITDVEILVDVVITVSPDRQGTVYFNNLLGDNKARILDDRGTEYRIIEPETNGSLALEPGERLDGTLAFQGPLDRGVRTIRLVLNANSEPGSDNPGHLRYPHFTFPEVPVAP